MVVTTVTDVDPTAAALAFPDVADLGRAERMVAASRRLVELARDGRLEIDGGAEDLVASLVGMVATTDTAINALAAQRAALLAVAVAVVDAVPGTMVPVLPDAPVTPSDRDHARRALVADVASATGASEVTTATLVATGEELVTNLPATLTAMAVGALGDRHARHVVRHAEGLPSDAMADYEVDVLGRLGADRSPAAVARTARAARERCHPRTLAERHGRASRDRSVMIDPAADGMAWLTAYLPAVQAGAIFDKLTGVARALGGVEGEKRTLAQRRADALTALVLDPPAFDVTVGADGGGVAEAPALVGDTVEAPLLVGEVIAAEPPVTMPGPPGPEPERAPTRPAAPAGEGPSEPVPEPEVSAGLGGGEPDEHGVPPPWVLDPALHALRPTVVVTVPVLTLLGRSDEPGCLDGYGPIDPDTARALAANAPSFVRVLTHPETGAVLSVGRDRYTVPADLRTWLRIRDETCRFPGCQRRAVRADVDHTVPFREGGHRGATAAENLAHLCPSHHRLKHMTRWSVSQHADGRLTWTSPTGRVHTTEPAVRLEPRDGPVDRGPS